MSDLSPEAAELLKRARASFSPDEARIAAMRAALAVQLGPTRPSNGPAGGAGAKVARAWTAKNLALVGVLAVVSAGARMLAGRIHGESLAPSTSSVPGVASSLSHKPSRAEPEPPQGPPSISVDDLPSVRPDPTAPRGSVLPASSSHVRDAVEDHRMVVSMPSASPGPASLRRELLPAEPASPSHDGDAVEESPAAVAKLPVPTPAASDTALAGEVSLLRAAHLALDRGDAATALVLLDRYAQVYPSGTLQEESLTTRALTLCALGRVAAAKEVARRLEIVAPRSPHLARVRASCAGGENRSE